MAALRSMTPLAALCCLAVALSGLQTALAIVEPNELNFTGLRLAGTNRQWTLKLSVQTHDATAFVPLNCSSPLLGACTDRYPPLQQGRNDIVRVAYNLSSPRAGANDTLNTWQGGVPTVLKFKLCYTTNSSINKAWRTKNKPYPRLSENCPKTFKTVDYQGGLNPVLKEANTGIAEVNFADQDLIPTATWFVMLWVYCGDTVCAFESTEGLASASPPVPGNFIETEVEMGITTGMRVAAITLSVISPLFFIIFWVMDHLHYKKTGRPITLLKSQ